MLDFPNTPTLNQVFTSGSLSWRWDGSKWVVSGAAPPTMILVTSTTTLATGFAGFVRVENNTSAPITITLPASPVAQQEITLKDTYGNAGNYAFTVSGGASLIEAASSIVVNFNYGWVDLIYTGSKWVQS